MPDESGEPSSVAEQPAKEQVTGVTVLVPARNAEGGIAATIETILEQRLPASLRLANIVVIANDCTDATTEIARQYPVVVLEMPFNPHKKSGAVNYGWSVFAAGSTYILTVDADTVLLPDTVASMARELEIDHRLGAVCARYWPTKGRGLVWRLQRLEYTRYDDLRDLRGWRVSVVSGVAAMYRQSALVDVCVRSSRAVPWDQESLIEDYALTLDLKTAGWRVRVAKDSHVYTQTPSTLRRVWRQRLRWGRGGMDECLKRGWTPATRWDILAYGLFLLSVCVRALWVTMLVLMLSHGVPLRYALVGLIPVAVMLVERVTSVWRLQDKTVADVLLAVLMIPEDLYGFFLETCAVISAWKCLRGKRQVW